jgi:VCBS repeat-containing protein
VLIKPSPLRKPVNDAPVVANAISNVSVPEDADNTVLNLSNTFSDADGQPLTVTVSGNTNPALVTASYDATTKNLTLSYNANKNGTATITVRATDGTTQIEEAFLVTVSNANDAPVADAQEVTTQEDTPQTITLTGSDADADALTYEIVTGPGKGSLTGTGAARTYTPNANTNGTDSFTFRVNDGAGFSAPATVTITVTGVNDAPIATAQSVTTAEDVAKAIVLAGTDVDANTTLTYAVVTPPAHGTFENGTYTPAHNYHGPDSFTFTASDGSLTSAPATVSISVTPVNDAPVAVDDAGTTNEDTPLAGTTVLANDTDIDGNALTAILGSGPAYGTLMLNSNGTYTYTPAANYSGPDAFTYRANDGTANSNLATVNITVIAVNQAPVAKISR